MRILLVLRFLLLVRFFFLLRFVVLLRWRWLRVQLTLEGACRTCVNARSGGDNFPGASSCSGPHCGVRAASR
ncbi:hypothetical protein ACGFXC_14945 [Streptomyces sp. NPDC048507]|uniref:hypothetical protein n=1 Tax=Streptomyces sp. NPDC048507 TaxID=3365560 RepID=UPI00371022F6